MNILAPSEHFTSQTKNEKTFIVKFQENFTINSTLNNKRFTPTPSSFIRKANEGLLIRYDNFSYRCFSPQNNQSIDLPFLIKPSQCCIYSSWLVHMACPLSFLSSFNRRVPIDLCSVSLRFAPRVPGGVIPFSLNKLHSDSSTHRQHFNPLHFWVQMRIRFLTKNC